MMPGQVAHIRNLGPPAPRIEIRPPGTLEVVRASVDRILAAHGVVGRTPVPEHHGGTVAVLQILKQFGHVRSAAVSGRSAVERDLVRQAGVHVPSIRISSPSPGD